MTKKYKVAVLIGRFEPFHNGHFRNLKHAFGIADRVLFLIGSSFQPSTPKNPLTYDQRSTLITHTLLRESPFINFETYPLRDHKYSNNNWIREVQRVVKGDSLDVSDSQICIMGYDKDDSSWYNHAFPAWDFIDVGGFVEVGSVPIDATKIRELLFEGHLDFIRGAVPATVFDCLTKFTTDAGFKDLIEEYNFYKGYDPKKFPSIMHTVDAVVVQGGHILLIQRGHSPGRGLWALPGGFLNPRETLEDGVIRELREETKIKVPEIVLRKAITYDTKFDHPDRDLRGRVITHAYLIELDGGDGTLPRVKGSDDAKIAKWFTLAEVSEIAEQLYGDHAHIIETMVARSRK
jgi:bifunctional NMN adenylyltransferase/nudix hydrolase